MSPFLSSADYWNHTPNTGKIAKGKVDLSSKTKNEIINYNHNYFNEAADGADDKQLLNINNFMTEKPSIKR